MKAFFALSLCGWFFAAAPAAAQVRCTMPNGVVIEQRLSSVCPTGAVKAQTQDGKSAPIRSQAPAVTDKRGHTTQSVRREELGSAWPLTVPEGAMQCLLPQAGNPQLVAQVIDVNGVVYAINGTAQLHAARFGWENIRPIWRDNPEIPGTKVPLSALSARASELCQSAKPAVAVAKAGAGAGDEVNQAGELCAMVKRAGASGCETKIGFFAGNVFDVTVASSQSQMRELCDAMKVAARTKYPAIGNSQRGWEVKIYHPMGSGDRPMQTCTL